MLGMDDGDLIGFWHIDQVRPLSEERLEYKMDGDSNLFVFADWSIWAHAYAIRLSSEQDDATAVFLIGLAIPCRSRLLLKNS
jgi:hypothetical protein